MGLRVIIQGFGGQGVKSLGDILAAALFRTGHRVLGMPIYAPLQMGGQVVYSLGIDSDGDRVVPLTNRDAFVMMHRCLFTPAEADTVRADGLIIANADAMPDALAASGRRVATVGADAIARRNGLVRANVPEIGTAVAGAFVRATGAVTLDAVEEAVRAMFPGRAAENIRSVRAGYEATFVMSGPVLVRC